MPLVRLSGPNGETALTVLETGGRDVAIGAWRLAVGRSNLILLDTNLPENDEEDRGLTYQLYGGGQEHRLKQEWILGVGGVRVLRALGISPGAWHANEGHAAFMMVERLREHVAAGASLEDGVRAVRARSVFTTHTPVPAGHDMFAPELVDGVCGTYHEGLGMDRDQFRDIGHHPEIDHGRFHMTAAAIRLSGHVNGVSMLHRDVTRGLWRCLWPGRDAAHVPIEGVTNGVHLGTWMSHRYMELLDEHLGPDWGANVDDHAMWERVLDLDDAQVWKIHLELKKALLDFCREESRTRWRETWKDAAHLVGGGTLLGPKPLTLGFARRFATYKRATLLFNDVDRLAAILTNPLRPVQILFAGKAHPADDGGKRLIQEIFWRAKDPRFEGRIAFVEDYDMLVASPLVAGVDVWLNNPKAPLEASGTSGMKAGANGVTNLSILDGWWIEGWRHDAPNGWGIEPAPEDHEQDAAEAAAIYQTLEEETVPLFYNRDENNLPREWIAMAKNAMRTISPTFSAQRMLIEYIRRLYLPASRGSLEEARR